MLSRRADPGAHDLWRTVAPASITSIVIAASVVICVTGPAEHVNSLSIILGVAAVVAGVIAMGEPGGALGVSASFIIAVLAAAFLGPASAALAGLITENLKKINIPITNKKKATVLLTSINYVG